MARETLKEIPNWLVKIYKFNEYLRPDRYMPLKTNLCHFCRVVFVVVPIKLAILTTVLLFLCGGLLYLLFVVIPNIGWLWHWLFWINFSVIFISWYVIENYKIPNQTWRSFKKFGLLYILPDVPQLPQWLYDLYNLIDAWLDAVHDRVCPLIELPDEFKDECEKLDIVSCTCKSCKERVAKLDAK